MGPVGPSPASELAGCECDRGEALQAGGALVRSADRRQNAVLDVRAIRLEALVRGDAAVLDAQERSLVDRALAQAQPQGALEHLERVARRSEEELLDGRADPERPADA